MVTEDSVSIQEVPIEVPKKVDGRKHLPHAFKPGNNANPKGRPKGSTNFLPELIRAMRSVEKEKRISILKHAWEESLKDNKLLATMLRKIVPDLTNESGEKGPTSIRISYEYSSKMGDPGADRARQIVRDAIQATDGGK